MKQLKKLLKSRAGFTLGEVMICMVILLLITAVIAGALPVASDVYYNTVDAANAQVLLSTTVAALRDELCTASAISVSEDSQTLSYRSSSTGILTMLHVMTGQGFALQYADAPDWDDSVDYRLLVTREAATGNLYAACSEMSYENGVITLKGLAIYKPGRTQPIASAGDFSIRVIDPV